MEELFNSAQFSSKNDDALRDFEIDVSSKKKAIKRSQSKLDPAWDDGSAFPEISSKNCLEGKRSDFQLADTCGTTDNEIVTIPKSKASDCWYTPDEIIALIQQCLSGITLDPCADDGKHVESCYHFTVADDGLSQQWFGRVFMNPPYSCPGVWIAKLQEEFNCGRVEEAMPGLGFAYALVPVATDTKWFHPLIASNLICFWKGRIKFLDVNYQPKMAARQSHCLIYWGKNQSRFRQVFSSFGTFNYKQEKEAIAECSNTPVSLQESPALNLELEQPEQANLSKQNYSLKTTPTLKQSSNTDFQKSQSTATSQTITLNRENSISAQSDEYHDKSLGTMLLNNCHGTEEWEEKQGNPAELTTNALIQDISTPSQNLQQPIGSFTNKDSVQQILPKLTESAEEQSTHFLSHTGTASEKRSNYHSSCSTELNIPLSQLGTMREPMESDRFFTEISGSTTMDKSVMDGTFTILTLTSKTTELKTLSVFPKENTPNITVVTRSIKPNQLGDLTQEKFTNQQYLLPNCLELQKAQFTQPLEQTENVTGLNGSGFKCLQCLTFLPELEGQQLPGTVLASKQPSSLKLTLMLRKSSSIASPTFQSTPTLEIITPNQESISSIGCHFPAPAPALQATEPDLTTQNQACGFKPCGALPTANPISPSSKILRGLSVGDFEQCLEDCEWSNIAGTIHKSFQQRNSERRTSAKGFSSLPTPTTYAKGSTGCRPAGATRLEQSLRKFITKGDKLNPGVPGWMMGFPVGWVEKVLMDTGETISIQLPFTQEYATTSTNAENVTTSTPDRSALSKQRSQSSESVTSPVLQKTHRGYRIEFYLYGDKIKFIIFNENWVVRDYPWCDYDSLEEAELDAVEWLDKFRPGEKPTPPSKETLFQMSRAFYKERSPSVESFISTQSDIKLLSTQEIIEALSISEDELDEFWNNEPALFKGFKIQWLGATIQKWRVESENKLPQSESIPEKFLEDKNQSSSIESLSLSSVESNTTPDKFLEESNADTKQLPPRKCRQRRGCLYKYLENKKLKNGNIASYPRVIGETRDPDNPKHWRWGFNWEEKVDGEWKGRSIGSVPIGAIALIQSMQKESVSLEEIIGFIRRSKNKG